jgi:hypothetical protein
MKSCANIYIIGISILSTGADIPFDFLFFCEAKYAGPGQGGGTFKMQDKYITSQNFIDALLNLEERADGSQKST